MSNYLLKWINFWPPFFFTGIRVTYPTRDFREIRVKLKLHFWNANYVGTQYGGSMFSMTDPFYMLMLIQNLGKEYVVWDKAATIRYLKPGRTDLEAIFRLTDEDLASIRQEVQEKGRMEWQRRIEIRDTQGELVAEVDKSISIKKR